MLNTERYGLTALFCLLFFSVIFNAQAVSISCPTGYIPVPGNSELGTQDFCVAKYEMKKSSASQPVSQAAGLPWTNLTATEAFNQCQAITVSGFDGKFQLISNPQWMTVARNLESVNANWSSGVVGNGMFARGHSDSNPNVALSVSNSNDPYDQTGNNSGQAANSGWEQKRRNQLTNGEYIWDLGGNVHELVDWHLNDNSYTAPPSGCTDAGGSSGWNEMNETVTGCSAQDKDIKPKNTSFTSATGMGQWYGGNAGVAFRGGKMSNGIETGIFQLAMYYGKANGDVGFRCSYTPKGAEPANQAPVATADSFSLKDTDGVTELDILANDTDEDKASLAITITNQSGLGGSATVAGQKLSYTPQAGYSGEDWIEYRLADKQGLTSEVVRVTIAIATTPSADALRQGLVVEYLFDDTKNPGLDTSGNDRHGTVHGNPQFVSGKLNTALHFDGSDDVIENIPGFSKGQTVTFNFWFKARLNEGGDVIMEQTYWNGSSFPVWAFMPQVKRDTGKLSPWAFGYTGHRDDFYIVSDGKNYRDDNWHMLTIITNGHSGKAYLDGKFYGQDNSSLGPDSWQAGQESSKTRIGYACGYQYQGCSSWQEWFKGELDNYRMYNRALTEAEITALHNEGSTPINKAPVATADNFSLKDSDAVTELDILANDTDEDKANLAVTITNQSGVGGSATVVGQKLSYTPQAGYLGEDWIEYHITDKQGLVSQRTRVTLYLWNGLASEVSRQGLVVEYLFDDTKNPGLDTSGNDRHGTVHGTPQFVSGKLNTALHFDGSDDVIENIPGFSKGQTVTFNFWFKARLNEGGDIIMEQTYWNGRSFPVWAFMPQIKRDTGKLSPWAFGYTGHRDDFHIVSDGKNYRDDSWHMLTIITNGHSGKAYLDGKFYGQDNSSLGPDSWQAGQESSKTRIGYACGYQYQGCSSWQEWFKGELDNYRMYDRPLVEEEINALYSEKIPSPNKPPVANADKFDVVNTAGVAELNILNNDSDEDKASLVVTITNQGGLGGTTTISGQTLKYTPQTDYIGQDWFEYQLTDKHGLKSDIARVTLDVQKYKPRAGIATVSPRQNIIDEDKRLITITHNTPGAKVWFQFHNLETGTITDYIEYTNPFYLYDSARIVTIVKGKDYLDGPLTSKDYVMCKQDSCGKRPYEKQLEWRDEQTQRVVTKAKVNQPVRLWWDIEYVRYCEESTPGHTVKKTRTPNGKTPAYTFTQSGSVESSWQCFNSHRKQTFPTLTGNDYRTLPLQVEKLDAPTTLTHKQQGVTMTLNWDKVNYASHYQLQYQKDGGTWQTTTVNGQTTQLPFTQGTYHFRLSACIPTTCDNVSQVLTKTINVAESPFIIHTLKWESAPITVGQTPKLIWNIEHAVQCTIQGQTYSHNQHHTFPVPYQPTVIKPVLTCNKTTGGTHEAISIPESLWLQVNKLSAPANLRKQ